MARSGFRFAILALTSAIHKDQYGFSRKSHPWQRPGSRTGALSQLPVAAWSGYGVCSPRAVVTVTEPWLESVPSAVAVAVFTTWPASRSAPVMV